MATNTDSNTQVTISAERLRELEKLEAELPKLLEKTMEEANAVRFAILRARDKADPEAHKQRTKEWQQRNKEEYNAKRRERYKKKKAAEVAANHPAIRPAPQGENKTPDQG